MLCPILCAFTKFAVSKSNVVIRYLKFKEADFILRDSSTYQYHCAQLELRADASKEYGINRNSYLNELRCITMSA